LELGAVLPTCEIGNDPDAIRDFAQTAEGLGYSHLLIYDHVLGAAHEDRDPPLTGPYTEADAFHEPMVLLGYLAAVTSRIELATGVLILSQRQTALVAKQAAELAILSRGRFRLGVGSGWNPVEYESLGVPFEGRGERLEAQVDLMRRLWSEPLLDHEDAFHRIDRASILPRPERPIPIWFGGMGKRPISRAARIGDGFTFGGINQPRDDYFAPPLFDVTGFLDDPIGTLLPHLSALQEPPLEGDWCQNAGLALAISIAALLNAFLLYRGLRREGVARHGKGWPLLLFRTAVANIAMTAALFALQRPLAWWLESGAAERVTWLATAIAVAVVAYFGVLLLLGMRTADFRLRQG